MRYHIRLYYSHDLDIISYMFNYEFNITRAIYSALTAFANNEVFVIDVPKKREIVNIKKQRYYERVLFLDEEKDVAQINILNMIDKGYRNSFLKNLLRQYLCAPCTENYLIYANDMDIFSKKFEIFKENKKVVKAGKEKNNSKVNVINKKNKKEKEVKKTNENLINEVNGNNVLKEKNNFIVSPTEEYEDSEELTEVFSNLIM